VTAIIGTKTVNSLTLSGDVGRSIGLQAGIRTAVSGLLLLQRFEAVSVRLQSNRPQVAEVSVGPIPP
jgi:hypothetical protein